MSRFTGLVLREGRFVIKKMCSFRNVQICVDGALMFNATLYMSAIQHVTSLTYIFRSISLRLVFFSLVFGCNFLLFFLVMVNVFGPLISGMSCILPTVNYLIIGQNYFVLGGGRALV